MGRGYTGGKHSGIGSWVALGRQLWWGAPQEGGILRGWQGLSRWEVLWRGGSEVTSKQILAGGCQQKCSGGAVGAALLAGMARQGLLEERFLYYWFQQFDFLIMMYPTWLVCVLSCLVFSELFRSMSLLFSSHLEKCDLAIISSYVFFLFHLFTPVFFFFCIISSITHTLDCW